MTEVITVTATTLGIQHALWQHPLTAHLGTRESAELAKFIRDFVGAKTAGEAAELVRAVRATTTTTEGTSA